MTHLLQWRFGFLIIILLLALSFAIPSQAAPSNIPAGGSWSGTTNRGHPMSFTVSDTGAQWSSFVLKTDFNFGSCSGTTERTVPGPGTISNNQFNWTSSTFSLTGQFTSSTTASGTYSFSQSIYNCGYLSQSGTWTASVPVPPPGVFGKNTPSNGAVSQSITPTLSWGSSSNATSYEYCYDTNNNDICDSSWINNGPNTSAILSGPAYNTTYYWQVRAVNTGATIYSDASVWWGFTTQAAPPPAPTTLVNSVLPTSRTVPVGTMATIFNTVINAGTSSASGVTLSLNPAPTGTFVYRQTDCATNAIIGSPNPTLDLAPGGVLCYVLSFTPSATFPATNVHIRAQASNAPTTNLLTGINTWLLRATSSPGPDIIALTTTTDFHQIACSGMGAFAVALSNVGTAATGDITVTANTGSATLPLSILISETNPGTGVVIGDNLLQNVGAGENRTVAVFVTFNGCINFDPAANRIFIEFRDAGNNVVGSTSTAVSTNR